MVVLVFKQAVTDFLKTFAHVHLSGDTLLWSGNFRFAYPGVVLLLGPVSQPGAICNCLQTSSQRGLPTEDPYSRLLKRFVEICQWYLDLWK